MKDSSSTDPTRPVNDDELREMTVERAGRADATGVVEEVRRAARVTRQTGAWRRSVMPTERTAPGRRSWVAGLGVAAAVLVAVALVESGLPWIGPTASGSAVPGGATSSAPTPAASVAILPSPTTVATAAPPDLWTSVTWMPVDVAVYMTNAVWFRDGFLALGPMNRDVRTIPATSTVWRSADGQTWERVPGPPVIPTDGSLAWLEAGADAAVIMGARDDGSGGLSPALWRSSDGLVWEKVFGEVVSHAEPFQLVAGPGGFLAAASDGSGVWRSTDGASWDSLGSTIPIDPSGTATSSVYLVPTIPAAAADAFFAITATGATSSPTTRRRSGAPRTGEPGAGSSVRSRSSSPGSIRAGTGCSSVSRPRRRSQASPGVLQRGGSPSTADRGPSSTPCVDSTRGSIRGS